MSRLLAFTTMRTTESEYQQEQHRYDSSTTKGELNMSTNRIGFPRMEDLEWVFSRPWSRVLICSPWIPTAGVKAIRRCLDISSTNLGEKYLELWLRISPEDAVHDQWTDIVALKHLIDEIESKENSPKIILRTADQLHAKIYSTEHRALVTSANLSSAGFGMGDVQNIEIVLRLLEEDEISSLWNYIRKARGKTEHLPRAALESIATAIQETSVVKSTQKLQNILETLKQAVQSENRGPSSPPHLYLPIR
jgi:hypothetical protein